MKRGVVFIKNFKKLIAVGTIIGVLGLAGVAAASYATGATTPAGIVSALTGKSVEQVTAERAAGKSYGTIANEAGKLEDFKTQTLERKKVLLDQSVAAGNLTQDQANAAYESIKANQATCDGTGRVGMGQGANRGSGLGMGLRNGGGFGCGLR
ncbi:hypothetical protein DSBG_0212 [Desulfosporosinus sp. BG]|nr:hypothetical protein DSBG_0212 [Desulfosporosinus sp. BG]